MYSMDFLHLFKICYKGRLLFFNNLKSNLNQFWAYYPICLRYG